jgi:uncharacterized protein (TIGR03083 family)
MVDTVRLRRELDRARARLEAAIALIEDADYARPVVDAGWTVRDVVFHVAAWDEVAATTVREIAAGLAPTRYIEDVDGFNAEASAAGHDRSPAACRVFLAETRSSFLAELDAAPPEAWQRQIPESPGGPVVSLPIVLDVWTRHDDEHADELEAFVAGRIRPEAVR